MRFRRDPGFAAAAVLATVTLSVFAVFQNYGPESAVRRFHHAVTYDDFGEMAQVVTQGINSSAVKELRADVAQAMQGSSGYYRILTSDRSEKQVVMLAKYQSTPPIVWVVVKQRAGWRIDPYLTLQALRRLGY